MTMLGILLEKNKRFKFFLSSLLLSCIITTSYGEARTRHVSSHKRAIVHSTKIASQKSKAHNRLKIVRVRYRHISSHKYHRGSYGRVIQCVAFARSASDVALSGNAGTWWYHASGIYDRGNSPEAGSVLSFRSTGRMPLGHVAVVKRVVDSRTILIDQSHWAQRGVSRNVPVIDVSPNNDWTAVRVALNSNKGTFGSIYPTHGFIYPRAEQEGEINSISHQNAHTWTADAADSQSSSPNAVNTEVALAPNVSNHLFDDAPNRTLK